MIRYYLVPFETNSEKMIADAQPKHLDVFGKANGLISKSLKKTGSITTEWLREYYVVRVARDKETDYEEIEKLTDIIRLDANTQLSKLSALGMDTSLVANREGMDKVVTKWLLDEERILSEVLK